MPQSRRYLRKLLILLVSAAFFQSYNLSILALLLPNLQETFRVGEAMLALIKIPINLGLFAAFFVTRLADRFGRRPLLLASTSGYALFTALTALSWDLLSFTIFQSVARAFLATEFTVAVTMIIEEFPFERRGRALGTLFTFDTAGLVAAALLLTAGAAQGPLEWRLLFLLGLPVLLPLLVARRRLRETPRFLNADAAKLPFFIAWRPPYRSILLAVGTVHMLRAVPLFGATAWWAYYAERELGLSETTVGIYVVAASLLGCSGYVLCGWLMSTVGYKPTAMVYLIGSAIATIALFEVDGADAAFVALLAAIALGFGVQPVLASFATILFPTEFRSQAAAWIRSWFELPGFILGPTLVGVLGDHKTGLIGRIGHTTALLSLLLVPAAYLVWRHVPEPQNSE